MTECTQMVSAVIESMTNEAFEEFLSNATSDEITSCLQSLTSTLNEMYGQLCFRGKCISRERSHYGTHRPATLKDYQRAHDHGQDLDVISRNDQLSSSREQKLQIQERQLDDENAEYDRLCMFKKALHVMAGDLDYGIVVHSDGWFYDTSFDNHVVSTAISIRMKRIDVGLVKQEHDEEMRSFNSEMKAFHDTLLKLPPIGWGNVKYPDVKDRIIAWQSRSESDRLHDSRQRITT